MNATDGQSTPGLGPVVVNGIQDVSAFLPILGTDQCEKHSTFYVAATPMSIFGSLGILKADLITLVLGRDIAVGRFHGPRLLQNAGFAPDVDLLMYALDSDDSVLVVEQKMRAILRGRPPAGVVPKLYSTAWTWNTVMVARCTPYLTFLGVLKDQITFFHHSQATPIEDALYLLAKNTNMRRGSPILIYVFFHSPVVRPKRIGDDESGMLYSRFFELVGRISEKHGDNVVVILDTNFPDLDPTAAVQLGMQPYVVVAASSDEDQSGRNLARELIPDLLRMLSTGSLGVVLEIQRRSRNFQKIIPQMLIQKLNIERQKRSLSPCFRCMRTPNNRPIFGGALALAKFQDFMITIFLDEEDEVRQGIPTDDAV